ncbi:hypothetical protein F8S09_17310 [Deinococcus sp. SDU3-2]|uniref:ParB/Sulfiredoxin domain-containing protein n=1 Tax=Deinococcus terrestris TaxID=2651870 RepID=A0A7X1TTF9_9DEIO|nr:MULTISPECIES: hypothetical protein [Deinococcus]MPY68411.1 hypothetical protein [Deinococcus terrestris]
MTFTLPAARNQLFSQVIADQQRIWVVTPMLWLMSYQVQSGGYTTRGDPVFDWMPTTQMVALAGKRRPSPPVLTPYELAVPPIVLEMPSPSGALPFLLDGIHRVDQLHALGIPDIQVMSLTPQVAAQFEVPVRDVPQVMDDLRHQRSSAPLNALYAQLGHIKQAALALRAAAAQAGRSVSAFPLPRTLLHQEKLSGPACPEVY